MHGGNVINLVNTSAVLQCMTEQAKVEIITCISIGHFLSLQKEIMKINCLKFRKCQIYSPFCG